MASRYQARVSFAAVYLEGLGVASLISVVVF